MDITCSFLELTFYTQKYMWTKDNIDSWSVYSQYTMYVIVYTMIFYLPDEYEGEKLQIGVSV